MENFLFCAIDNGLSWYSLTEFSIDNKNENLGYLNSIKSGVKGICFGNLLAVHVTFFVIQYVKEYQ